jgi:circadian clock protein KaiC
MQDTRHHASGADALVSTGISGMDSVLGGGLTPARLYVLEGEPGTGKTTFALQFLLEGLRLGESAMYVTLSESALELRAVAASHGWTLEGMHIHELITGEGGIDPSKAYTVFHPSEVELGHTTRAIYDEVERVKPARVVLDSLSDLRPLSGNAFHYRQQVMALKQFFVNRGITILVLDDLMHADTDLDAKSIAHGVILLEQRHLEYGAERRRLRVGKYRGHQYRGGYHDFVIRRGGLGVFPRLVAADSRGRSNRDLLASGIEQLDALLGGGVERGTSTLITGAAGTGKSTVAAKFAEAATSRGQNAAMFIFDESASTLRARSAGLAIDLDKAVADGRLILEQVDPAELSPGEFVDRVVHAVEKRDCAIVVLDSLNGYLHAMPDERNLIIQLHELLSYLGQRGVASIVIGVQQGLIGHMSNVVDASYLADAIVLMRYFEAEGRVRQAVSVMKRRGGMHERTIREFLMNKSGLHVGEPLSEFRGVLTGVPEYVGDKRTLMSARRA